MGSQHVDSQRTTIVQAVASLSRELVADACSRFQSYVEAVLEAEGSCIE